MKAVPAEASQRDPEGRSTALFQRVPASEGTSSAYVLWAFFAFASVAAAVGVCFTPGAERRFTLAMRPSAPSEPSPSLARLEIPRPAQGSDQAELLSRLNALEDQMSSGTTGSIQPSSPVPELQAAGVTPTAAPAPTPVKTTAVSTNEPENSATRTVFGVDLGAETSFGALRVRWENLRRQYPELGGLTPRISVRDNKGKVELRLVAGPFDNAADAAKACAGLLAKGTLCDGGLFEGQRLPAS